MSSFETHYQDSQSKEAKKLTDGSISFPFIHETPIGMIEFDLRIKKNTDGKVTIENKTKITEKNKGYILNKDSTFTLNTEDKQEFAQSLGKALDAYIGKGRKSVDPKKREQAYTLLGFKEKSYETLKKEEIMNIKSELNSLKNELPKNFSWDEHTKTLKVEYNIGYGSNEKVLYTIFRQEGDKVVFTLSSGYLRSIAPLSNQEIKFDKNNLVDQIKNHLSKTFSEPLTYKRVIGKDTEYTMKKEVQEKAVQKATTAAEIFLRYSKETK